MDVIVLGAGLSGLLAASRLARAGKKVLVVEKNVNIGGTSHVFRRGPYLFPMGPLSFGFPREVDALLDGAGVRVDWTYRRNHFQLIGPGLDVVYSRPPAELLEDLKRLYPAEAPGLEAFFAGLRRAELEPGTPSGEEDAGARLDRCLQTPALKNLLGSQGFAPPEMSMGRLAAMWRVMSEVGIWFPSCGIHGLGVRLGAALRNAGGRVALGEGASGIVVENGRVAGVRLPSTGFVAADWVISTADYKTTFLDLLPPSAVPPAHLEIIRSVPYSGSEICVYLGLDSARVDWGRLKATHLSIPQAAPGEGEASGSGSGGGAEIEICRWSENLPDSAPAGRETLLLRAGASYDAFARWRTGEKTRLDGYGAFKESLARWLVRRAESVLPGLSSSIEAMESATPLTYRDSGRRTLGSIAGWSWRAGTASRLPGPMLVETPVRGLLTAGLYAAAELSQGGVPTALGTAELAARIVLESGF